MGDPVNGARYIGVYEYDSQESMTGINDSDAFKAAIQEMQERFRTWGFINPPGEATLLNPPTKQCIDLLVDFAIF